jgi:hypothetical protein
MRLKTLPLAIAFAVTLVGAAHAADKKPASAQDVQFVDVSPVAAPIVLHGRLINYVFVSLRLHLAPNADAIHLRDEEPYFRDALVRIAHRRPFVKPGDYTHVDEGALKAAMLEASARIAGPGMVRSVDILSAQPQKVSGLPHDAPTVDRAPIP